MVRFYSCVHFDGDDSSNTVVQGADFQNSHPSSSPLLTHVKTSPSVDKTTVCPDPQAICRTPTPRNAST